MKRDIKFANEEFRVEQLSKISYIVENFLNSQNLTVDQAKIDVEPNCGPMIVLSFDNLIVLQNVDGSCAALDINPFGNQNIGKHWVVLNETNKIKSAIVISEAGFMVYFSDVPFLKNQILSVKPDDFWNCDFMSDEKITAVF